MAQIIRFPNDGLGIAILTNDSPLGQIFYDIVKWRIAEELLGLPVQVDWNARSVFIPPFEETSLSHPNVAINMRTKQS